MQTFDFFAWRKEFLQVVSSWRFEGDEETVTGTLIER
jgi:hypothetical protein